MAEKEKSYEFLDHVGDAYISAYGDTLENAFENAAKAMSDVMTNVHKIEPITRDEFIVEAKDEVDLLHEWLDKVLLAFDIEGKLYSKFNVKKITSIDGKIVLKAEAYGESFDPSKHPSKVEIKAVTYHRIAVEKLDKGVTVRFILDL